MGVLFVSLLLASVVGSIDGTASCNYYDPTGAAVPSLTPKGDQKLSCPSAKILVLLEGQKTGEYDNVICLNGEWFATSCTGAASSLGASVSAGCTPDAGIKWCGIVGLAGKKTPAMNIVDGAQVRTCAADETITVPGLSANLGFTRATCLGNLKWLLFNCEGSIEPVDAPLTAYCEKSTAPPATTVAAPTTTGVPPPSITTAAPGAPTTTAASSGLGELQQMLPSNVVCRDPECDFRYYSSEMTKIVNMCNIQGSVWSLAVACKTGTTRIEGFSAPAGHIAFSCQNGTPDGGTGIRWYSLSATTPTQVTVSKNPIVRCDQLPP